MSARESRRDQDGQEPRPTVSRAPVDFDEWYRREYPRAVRFAYALTHDAEDAEDLAQDAFIAASARWDELSTYERPDLWVRRAISNRSKSRLRRLYSTARTMARLRAQATFVVDPTTRVEDHEALAALAQLPERQRTAVALTYLEDRPLAEIAEVLQCTVETARTHRRRGEARLQTLIGGTEDERRDQ